MFKIMLATQLQEERRLISSWSREDFEVGSAEYPRQLLTESFDICIFDLETFNEYRKMVVKRKSSDRHRSPRFLAAIDRNALCKIETEIGYAIDDILYLPLKKSEFDLRISIQLKLKSYAAKYEDRRDKLKKCKKKTGEKPERLRILAIDDYVLNHKIIEFQLHDQDVTIVDGGAKAVEILGKEQYDLVLLDIQMPEMDGFQTAKTIRNPESGVLNPEIPIIALSAHEKETQMTEAAEAEIDGFVKKPLQRKTLFAEIERVLASEGPESPDIVRDPIKKSGKASEENDTNREKEIRGRSYGQIESQIPKTKIMDLKNAIRMMGGKEIIVEKVCDSLIREAPKKLEFLKGNISSRNFKEAQRISHDLKSGARCVCAEKAADLSYKLEMFSKEQNEEKMIETLPLLENAFKELFRELRAYRKA